MSLSYSTSMGPSSSRCLLRIVLCAALFWASSCKREPPLAQRMAGPWRATIEYGARASKDPLVRGVGKAFHVGGKLRSLLQVGPDFVEVRRPSAKAGREVVQRATFVALDRERIALTSERGRLVARVTLECNKDACLAVKFSPEPGADPGVVESMAFLFGCDDLEGNINCNPPAGRPFYRYPAGSD